MLTIENIEKFVYSINDITIRYEGSEYELPNNGLVANAYYEFKVIEPINSKLVNGNHSAVKGHIKLHRIADHKYKVEWLPTFGNNVVRWITPQQLKTPESFRNWISEINLTSNKQRL